MQRETLIKLDLTTSERDADTGELRVNVGSSESGEGYGSYASVWAADGFFGMPNEPSDAGACVGLVHIDGNNKRIVATKDNRFIGKYAEMQPGDRAIVTDGPARMFLKKATKSIALYTEDEDGNVFVHDVNGDLKAITMMAGGKNGTLMFQMDAEAGTISIGVDGGGQIILNKDGCFIYGGYCGLNTGKGNLGVMGGVAPIAPAQGIEFGPAPGSPSSTWSVAP